MRSAFFALFKLISICLRLWINDWHKMLRNILLHFTLINQWLPMCAWFQHIKLIYCRDSWQVSMMGYTVLAAGVFVYDTYTSHISVGRLAVLMCAVENRQTLKWCWIFYQTFSDQERERIEWRSFWSNKSKMEWNYLDFLPNSIFYCALRLR